ncbi:hypothetical protein L596_015621 [Steinernema carpocapsae]|uniref:K Homology domain-containing protein n=1 Tax=Steinernema carpocapsae TaxID=34508 RepID=A0A4V6A348_STECR|nr:hypothetical protein L596_015621 [Steinernema carpocapsae]
MTAKVAQTQHRYIIGSRGSGIHEILRETDVVVEVPSEEEKSDVITLHGEQSKLGLALAQIYSKAASHVSTNIKCPMWMHKKLIGPKGATLEKLVPESKEFNNLKVEFEDGGVIYIEGSPDKVKNAQVALQAEIGRLEKTETSEVIKVDPKYHKHIIGRNRSVLNKICGENTNVHVQVPDEGKHSFEIRVEGDRVLVPR